MLAASMTRLSLASLAAVLVAGSALAQPSPAERQDATPAQLLAELRAGGRVVFFRHAATDFGENDSRMAGFDDCAHQRNLVDKGRDDARKIGIAIRTLGIPIGRVMASPFCRTVETAELAFGRAERMNEARYATGTAGPERYADLRALLGTRPAKDNTVIVGHGTPFYALTGVRLAEGEVAVIRPLEGEFQIIGRIRPDGWAALRAAAR
jgi:phosphohistidine phosphatase SixA